MNRRRHRKVIPEVTARPLQVTLEEAGGDQTRLIKKFMKKVRKDEVLKPYYDRLMYFIPKSQKRRFTKRKAAWEQRRQQEKQDIE